MVTKFPETRVGIFTIPEEKLNDLADIKEEDEVDASIVSDNEDLMAFLDEYLWDDEKYIVKITDPEGKVIVADYSDNLQECTRYENPVIEYYVEDYEEEEDEYDE